MKKPEYPAHNRYVVETGKKEPRFVHVSGVPISWQVGERSPFPGNYVLVTESGLNTVCIEYRPTVADKTTYVRYVVDGDTLLLHPDEVVEF